MTPPSFKICVESAAVISASFGLAVNPAGSTTSVFMAAAIGEVTSAADAATRAEVRAAADDLLCALTLGPGPPPGSLSAPLHKLREALQPGVGEEEL